MVPGDEKGRGPPLSRMALVPAWLQPDAAEWSGATGGNASAVLGRVTWENDEQAGGWVLPLRRWQRACLVRLSALDCRCSRRRRLLSMLVAQGEYPPCRVVRAGSRAFWQRSEFRCSFPGPIGRQMSFGVVETLLARSMGPFWRNMRPQTGRFSPILLFLQQNSKPRRVGRLPVSGIITPKLVSLPLGTPRLLRNAICCRRDPGKPMKKSPQPQPLPPGVKNRAGGAVRRTGLSLRTYQRPGRGRAGNRT